MDPIRLQIENFCSYSQADISFNFSSALIIGKIKGNEKFSNGAGKSTIFAAIKYVLFNEVDFSTLDKAIRHGTDSCKITFDFRSALDGDVYRIVRSRSKRAGSEVRLYIQANDAWEDITQRRNPDNEKEIAKIIKINYKTFCNSVLFAQTDLSGLASLTPEKRKLALKEALQLNVYSKYEIAAKQKTAELVKEIDKEKTVLKTLGYTAEDINKFKKELEEVDNILSNKNNYLLSVKSLYEKEGEKYTALTSRFDALERQSAESIAKQKSTQDEVRKISESIKDYNKKIEVVGESGSLLAKNIEDISNQINKLKIEKIRDKQIVKNDIEKITQELIDKKSVLNSQLSKLEELKIPLPTGTTCKYCRQHIKDRVECQAAIDTEIIEKETTLKIIMLLVEKLNATCSSLKKELENIESVERKLASMTNSILNSTKEVETKRALYAEYCELLENNKNLLLEKNNQLDVLKKNQFVENAEEYSKLKINISNTKAKLTSIHLDIDDTSKAIVSLSSSKAVLLHKIEERKKDHIKSNICIKNIEDLEGKFAVHQKVVQAFGSKGIPALITHTILDDFQVETNYWLSRIRPGLQLQFSVIKDRSDGDKEDTLDISYVLDGFDLEHEQLSGAQKFIVALALKLGLTSVIKKRLGVEIGLLLIDEVDKSIDEGGLEAFAGAVKLLQQDFKVLVITHNNELKDNFNHAILVEKDENSVATAKVVNTW